jgi:hypothetical protein
MVAGVPLLGFCVCSRSLVTGHHSACAHTRACHTRAGNFSDPLFKDILYSKICCTNYAEVLIDTLFPCRVSAAGPSHDLRC